VITSEGSGEAVTRLLYRVGEAAVALGLSRAKVYELINSGALRAVRIDGARRIKAADLEAFVAALGEDAA
jgi:excisionase family DNA binding protein